MFMTQLQPKRRTSTGNKRPDRMRPTLPTGYQGKFHEVMSRGSRWNRPCTLYHGAFVSLTDAETLAATILGSRIAHLDNSAPPGWVCLTQGFMFG